MSREKAPWTGHIWVVAPLTILGVALPHLLMGFARKDGDKAGAGCRRRDLVASWAHELIAKWKPFPTLIF